MYRNQADELAELVRAHAKDIEPWVETQVGIERVEKFWDYLEEVIQCELYNTDDLDFDDIDPENSYFFDGEFDEYLEYFIEGEWMTPNSKTGRILVGMAIRSFYEAIIGTEISGSF